MFNLLKSKVSQLGLLVDPSGRVTDPTLKFQYWNNVTTLDLSVLTFGCDYELFVLFPELKEYIESGRLKLIIETDHEYALCEDLEREREIQASQQIDNKK